MRCSAAFWEQYSFARERLQATLAEKIRSQMTSLVGNMESADLLLVAADGKKLAAHECILRARAPGFYLRHVEPTVSAMGPPQAGRLREVAIGDIDSAGLEFFIHSVYTEDEIAQFPPDGSEDDDKRDSDSRTSNHSFGGMEESTDLDDFQSQEKEEHCHPQGDVADQTPTNPLPGNQQYTQLQNVPVMTSFRDLATHSPMNSSMYSLGGRSEVGPDIPEEDEDGNVYPVKERIHSRQEGAMSKFIRLDSMETPDREKVELERKRSSGHKAIFPMFIGLDEPSGVYGGVPEGVRGRAIMAKRLSVASLTSLTSIDVTPSGEASVPQPDRTPCSKLASDLLQMYLNNRDTDVIIKCENGELYAHKCILSATCPFFRQHLSRTKRIELKGYSRVTVHFLLSFLYGGLTSIPDEADVWEVVSLATHLNLKDLTDVVVLHLKATKCHWFHRPCASCVSAVFDALPHLCTIRSLKPLYDEAIQWQARYFARIWKGRVFMYLNEKWHKECFEGVIQQLDDETAIDTILSCERLQVALPRSKSDAAYSVLNMVNDVLDLSIQYLIHSFHLVVTSRAFATQGKGLALNLGILEDILPTLVHSLSADVAIKSYKGLGELIQEIQSVPPSPKKTLSIPIDEWSPRFLSLVRRLHELVDKHLLHYAASVVRADAWSLLDDADQERIRETGLFVEMRQPKAPPPRLSSNNRAYKRSASAGVQLSDGGISTRGRSIERGRPLSTIQQKITTAEKDEVEDKPMQKPPENAPVVAEQAPKQTVEGQRTPERKEGGKGQSSKSPRDTNIPRQKSLDSRASRSRETSQDSPSDRLSKESAQATPSTSRGPSAEVTSGRTPTPEKSGHRELKHVKSPIKKKVIESEQGKLERQHTHTIMSADPSKAAQLPGPSPKKATEKPKSVVKPMPKDPPLAATASRTLTRTVPKTSSSKEGKTTTVNKSSIPQSVSRLSSSKSGASPKTAPSSKVAPQDSKRKPESGASKVPRSPKSARKSAAGNSSIDKN